MFLKEEGASETETRHRCEDYLIEIGCEFDSSGYGQNPGAPSCEHGNKTSGSKDEEMTSSTTVRFSEVPTGPKRASYPTGIWYSFRGTNTVKTCNSNQWVTSRIFETLPPCTQHVFMRVICDGFWHTVFGASGAG
jgi:hypothetical protein